MEKYINEHGKECYRGVELDSPFSAELFHYPEWQGAEIDPDGFNMAFHSELGSLTMCDRMTGYGHRDIESAYRDKDGKFWLASGGFDVRRCGAKTVGEAIEWVKRNANTCVGD